MSPAAADAERTIAYNPQASVVPRGEMDPKPKDSRQFPDRLRRLCDSGCDSASRTLSGLCSMMRSSTNTASPTRHAHRQRPRCNNKVAIPAPVRCKSGSRPRLHSQISWSPGTRQPWRNPRPCRARRSATNSARSGLLWMLPQKTVAMICPVAKTPGGYSLRLSRMARDPAPDTACSGR